ncbi:MAG TPA: carbohydrate-binding family 9-like protein [Myxococcota bacterium]|jgi:hypothetical protein|nr:carbohydrate-binding family 9-like protein [Myxococcota bacterium]
MRTSVPTSAALAALALALGLAAVPAGAGGCACGSRDDAIRAAVLSARPAPAHPLDVTLAGGTVRLLGWDAAPQPAVPGGPPLTLTLYWESLAPLAEDWRVFVHVEGRFGGRPRFQMDHDPVAGAYPTSAWKPGQIIKDDWTVPVPADFTVTDAALWVGLYRDKTNAPVAPATAADRHGRVRAGMLAFAPPPGALKRLVVPRAAAPPVVDGLLDDPAWAAAATTGPFTDTMTGGETSPATSARLLWHESGLYVAFDCADEDVHSSFSARDDPIYKEEAVEVFLDGDGDGEDYVELQSNPGGVIFDSFLPRYRANQNGWTSGMVVGTHVDGTYNVPGDVDRGWTVEMMIPWSAVADAPHAPPLPGDVWRANLFRLEMPPGASTNRGSAWSPPLVGDFHALWRFGELELGGGP